MMRSAEMVLDHIAAGRTAPWRRQHGRRLKLAISAVVTAAMPVAVARAASAPSSAHAPQTGDRRVATTGVDKARLLALETPLGARGIFVDAALGEGASRFSPNDERNVPACTRLVSGR
jgi:hypothetical protein